MTEEEKKEEKKIIVDEDWKQQAQKEKEVLAAQEKAAKQAEKEKEPRGPLPPGDFAALVSMLVTQALFALGLLVIGCATHAGASQKEVNVPTEKLQVTGAQKAATASPSATLPDTPTLTAAATDVPTQTHTPEPTITPTPTQPGPPSPQHLIPDSEVVFSASAADFDTAAYLEQANGFLSTYRQYLMITAWTDAPAVIDMVAIENTINPRLLIALLEYQCGCVLGMTDMDPEDFSSAMGAEQAFRQDFYGQLIWTIHELSEGYYGWKDGTLTEISFSDGTILRPPETLNAGSFAVMYLFSLLYEGDAWEQAVDPEHGFAALYQQMFGDPWARSAQIATPRWS